MGMMYSFYIEQPMQMIQLNLNMIIDNDPHLISALDRSFNHPLIRKYGNIPFIWTKSHLEKILFCHESLSLYRW